MPVTAKGWGDISQRGQYAQKGIGTLYWDLRDKTILSHIQGGRILDAGCGEGITLERVTKNFPEVAALGVDVDPENIRICNEHGLDARKGSLYALPFDDNSFDTILFLDVIEHLETPEIALRELSRVTRPGGRLIILFPVDWAWWLARVICLRWKEARFDPGHLRQWNFRDLDNAVRAAGLSPLIKKSLPLPFPCRLHGLLVAVKD